LTTTDPIASPAPERELVPLTARDVAALNGQFEHQSPEDILAWAWERFDRRAAIGTSFQGSGLVMMHLAKMAGLNFPVFTLDTGLLFPETRELHKRLEDFFGWRIESIVPDLTVEQQAEVIGPDLWTSDPDLCCTTRKVLPLQSKLRELDCWITGLRRHQTLSRADIGLIELYTLDARGGSDVVKLNPMANWPREAIWRHIRQHQIPYNPLHDRGYKSIGCLTCTRKTARGEDERAGRWIGFKKVECGIHTFMPRKIDFQI
jgi:phosphoadenosine phosphosulfate reductase